eukprot:TRINITY_DN13931_c0_g1_i1.p1 TRINITY_DN13931_c0_g1~~TRINITY_DN13931_c0_g1_i1.p1  ORF type:complete len:149 (+),score=71.99 TRINITY_DN13931_c0_g1_i1:95-541(+)
MLRLAAAAAAAVLLMAPRSAAKQDCKSLGFGDDLVCTTCSKLQQAVGDPQLVDECRKCCIDTGGAQLAFDSALLEMDERQKVWMPELGDFVERHAKGFSKLKVRYTPGKQPTLKMTRNKDDGKKETDRVLVASWRSEQLVDYLKAKLR